jgi:hypothetical protein
MMTAMPSVSRPTAGELRLFVLVPRDDELAGFIQDALAFKRISLHVGRTQAEALAAVRNLAVDALLVDIDALSPGEAGELQAAITAVPWPGRVIAIGAATPSHREQLVIHHELSAELTSTELRDAMLAISRR